MRSRRSKLMAAAAVSLIGLSWVVLIQLKAQPIAIAQTADSPAPVTQQFDQDSALAMGYARSLGVNCTHCHVPEKWESDEKPQKQIARDMAAMVAKINGESLKAIKNLKSQTPSVNCTTCHRGQVMPALNLPPAS